MNWQNKKVLVTGADGFIGSHLAEKLVALGAKTRALAYYNHLGSWGWLDRSSCHDQIEVVLGDICDRQSLLQAMKGVDIVFHLAALIGIPYSYQAAEAYVRTNIEGTLNILQIARDLSLERVIHTSTSEVYGTAQYVPIDEKHPLQGQSPYSASKIGADKLAEAFHCSFGVPVVTVRPFNTYGPRQSARAVIPTIITQCLVSDKVRLGNLDPIRDLNYVDSIVEGFLLAASSGKAVGQTVNLGSGRGTSIGELAEMIMKIIGKKVGIVGDKERMRPEKSEVERLIADNAQALHLLGWKPNVSLEDGLKKTIDWFKQNLDRYRPHVYTR